jgi:hypothetical protein
VRPSLRFAALCVGFTVAATFLPTDASAQRRGGARTGTAQARVSRPVSRPVRVHRPIHRSHYYRYYRTSYYRPYYYGFYGGFYRHYDPFWWGYYGWSPFWSYPPYYYYPRWDPSYQQGAARIEVKPRETEVYVDGYFAGLVDDFDGIAQRLRLEPGEHEIELFLEGHRSIRQTLMFTRGTTLRIKATMEKLGEGEAPAARPKPVGPPPAPPAPARADRPDGPPPDRGRLEGPRPARRAPAPRDGLGSLSLRVQPEDAEVLVDGEAWERPAGQRLVIELPAGSHRIEVRRDGYQPYVREVRIEAGEATSLNVSLLTGEPRE